MLRMHFLQHRYSLSDPGAEEALYDAPAFRRFAGIDLGRKPAPDETAVCRFRRRLEAHDPGGMLLRKIGACPADSGLKAGTGAITGIIPAPGSAGNRSRQRDPDPISAFWAD